jgi:ABC-type branched-subunit amino acid transport system ATPase component
VALLETRNLSKSFGGLQAINNVSLKVEPNTVHGLIGPNGSGKSTFFNLADRCLSAGCGKLYRVRQY